MSLDKSKSENVSKQDTQDGSITWGRLIRDAELEVELVKKKITSLKKSIRFFAK
jgi:hypothetical protein